MKNRPFFTGVLPPRQGLYQKACGCAGLIVLSFFGLKALYMGLLCLLILEQLAAFIDYFAKRRALAALRLSPPAPKGVGVWPIWAIWGGCLALCAGLRFFYAGQVAIIILSALAYALDGVFIHIGCPFRRFFIKCRCCCACRIYHFTYPMLVTGIITLPNPFGTAWAYWLGGAAGIMALLLFALWERAYRLRGVGQGGSAMLSRANCARPGGCLGCRNAGVSRKGF